MTALLSTLALLYSLAATERVEVPPDRARTMAVTAAMHAGYADPQLVIAVAWLESRFDPRAIGDGGRSCGMTQIRHDFPGRPACEESFDPRNAIAWTARKLRQLEERCPDQSPLAAYNAGCRGARRGNGHHYARRAHRLVAYHAGLLAQGGER
jgi:soluble lytic murein transglycosylase-like protein